MRKADPVETFSALLGNKAAAVALIFISRQGSSYASQISKEAGLPLSMVQKSLIKLFKLGILTRKTEGRANRFFMNTNSPFGSALEQVAAKALLALEDRKLNRYFSDEKDTLWDTLASFGVPLKGENRDSMLAFSWELLEVFLQRATKEAGTLSRESRKREALHGYLLALKTHYPTLYRKKIRAIPGVRMILEDPVTGRVIKLYRYSKESVSILAG